MKIAIDTNVLVYAEGLSDGAKRSVANSVLRRIPERNSVISVQVLGELFNVLTRKGNIAREEAYAAVLNWRNAFTLVETSERTMLSALDLAKTHKITIWDSLVFASAAEANCTLLLSEDLQEGFVWSGVTVANPFKSPLNPLLADALRELPQ
jgi:predicted nucleic acid-binding protein